MQENIVEQSPEDDVEYVTEPPHNANELANVEDGGSSSSDEVCCK